MHPSFALRRLFPAAASAPIPPEVDAEVVRRLLDATARFMALAVANTLLAVAMLSELPVLFVGLWIALILAYVLLRYRVLRAVGAPDRSLAAKVQLLIRFAAISGVVQATPLLAFPWLEGPARAYVSIILMGLSTGSVASCSGHPRMSRAYCIPVLGGLVIAWLASPVVEGGAAFMDRSIGLLILLFFGILMGIARSTFQTLLDNDAIRAREQVLNERLQKALASEQEASSAKTRFLAAASHDLRQPLHTLSMLSATLALRTLDARSRDIVTLMGEVTESLNSQLDGLLDISKLDAGVVQADFKAVDLRALVQGLVAEIEPGARERRLTLRLQWDAGATAVVRTDPVLLLRVLRNLCDNAIKFTPPGGEIRLQAMPLAGGQFAELRVTDTGIGIAPEHQARVFQEFYQVANAERDSAKGLGLGLSIVARLARLLDIDLQMTSVAGQGSSFRLCVPLAPAGAVAETRLAVSAPGAEAMRGLDVLVVDDEPVVRAGTRMLLEELGCRCREAVGVRQAGERAAEARPDLVLADFRLTEGASGLDAIAAVRRHWPATPAVLVSGDTAPERLREAADAGIVLLHKPLSLAMLRAVLEAAAAGRAGD